MAGVVDRLLAQLPGLQDHQLATPKVRTRPAGQWTSSPAAFTPADSTSQRRLVGAWARIVLGLALSVTMGGWPYSKACGLPLAAYLGAIMAVILAGAWAAIAAWKYRAGLAHIVSLLILFYGVVLAAAELLPRSGYSVDRATWACHETT
jgi:hypothetical protein